MPALGPAHDRPASPSPSVTSDGCHCRSLPFSLSSSDDCPLPRPLTRIATRSAVDGRRIPVRAEKPDLPYPALSWLASPSIDIVRRHHTTPLFQPPDPHLRLLNLSFSHPRRHGHHHHHPHPHPSAPPASACSQPQPQLQTHPASPHPRRHHSSTPRPHPTLPPASPSRR